MSSSLDKSRLPIGAQTFRHVRRRNCHYVDKTGFAQQLVREGTHYFLSRPRRFGKSLFVSTLRSLFECERDLFEGLTVEPHWDWSRPYPVVHLDLSGGDYHVPGGLRESLASRLEEIEEDTGIEPRHEGMSERFAFLLRQLRKRTGQRIVVLVDEYDKPILDVLERPEMARANRDDLRSLYGVIKRCDEHVRFCLLTGVSKFSKVSLFSGLNNLEDITLDPNYSTICGYTESDLDTVFADWLEGLDRERITEWYNGYSWDGEERVYNPFDILLLLKHREYSSWWFETGTPTFLIEQLLEKGVSWHLLDRVVASGNLLSQFDVGDIAPEALLFQAGYLTVRERIRDGFDLRYRLGYPNREVRQSLSGALRDRVLGRGWEKERQAAELREALEAGNLGGLEKQLKSLLASIPHQWHGKNPMGAYEGWYASVLYVCFVSLGSDVRAEESGSQGRSDLVVRLNGRVWVFEFKMRERAGPGAALQQLKERGYAERYRGLGEPVHLVGVELSAETRNVVHFESQTILADDRTVKVPC